MIRITVALARVENLDMGESAFRRITFERTTFNQCMEAARTYGWTGKVVHLDLGYRTVILTERKEDK